MRVPGGHHEVLSAASPIIGDAAAATNAAAFTGDVSNDCVTYSALTLAASAQLSETQSAGVRLIRSKLEASLAQGTRFLKASADAARHGFLSYAAEIERIHHSALLICQSIDGSLATIRDQYAVIDEIATRIRRPVATEWRTPPSPQMPMPLLDHALSAGMNATERESAKQGVVRAHESTWCHAVTRWTEARDSIETEERRWVALGEDRRHAERALLQALHSTELGQLITVGSRQGSVGPKHTIAMGISGQLWDSETAIPGATRLMELLEGDLAPAEIAERWAQLESSDADIDALIQAYPFELANLDGLPFSVMDRAGRAALQYALDAKHPEHLEVAFYRMGFRPSERTIDDFRGDLNAVRKALVDAEANMYRGDTVQLLSLGSHDGAATAAISMGNLDTASTVGAFVSGMSSNVRGISDAFEAFAEIRAGDTRMAMMTWVGYRSPGLVEEPFQDRADAGSQRLASLLFGFAAQRSADPPARLVVIGHSYGTNVAAETLKIPGVAADALVTIGSAGLKYGTTAADLGVNEIYATQAAGDGIAVRLGQRVHFRTELDGGGFYEPRVDPRSLEGAQEFSSEQSADGKAVTMHNLLHPMDLGPVQEAFERVDGVEAADQIGYFNKVSSTVKALKRIMRSS